MFFPGRFTLSQSSPPVRNATHLRTSYFRIYSRDSVNQHVFRCSIYIETAENSREERNEQRLSLCLSRDSLSCDIRSLDLCILFKFIFLYLWYILPHSCAFHTFYFTPIFSYVYYRAKHFNFLSLMTLLLGIYLLFIISAVKGLIWTIFFFLTFILLIQLNLPWNIRTNLLIFTNKASSHVVIV